MAALNRGAIVTAVESHGGWDDTAFKTKIQQQLVAAEALIWNAGDWQFRKVASIGITYPVTGIISLPADFGSSLQLLDDNGSPLLACDALEFDRAYQKDIASGIKAQRPEAYKVVNNVVTVAPTPAAAIAGFMAYQRCQFHYASDGVTVVAGEMANDTDLPPFPSRHHMTLVWATLTLIGSADADIGAVLWDQSYEATLQAMQTELTGADTGIRNSRYGRDTL